MPEVRILPWQGLVLVGAGALAGLVKPYSLPAMLAERRWRAIGIAAAIAVITVPVLPWALFIDQLSNVEAALTAQAYSTSAWGNPLLMLLVAVSLVALGPRLGLLLAVPGLWPNPQIHYSVFSARAGVDSAFLALVLAIPRAAPLGIVIYAVALRVAPWASRRLAASRFHPGNGDRGSIWGS